MPKKYIVILAALAVLLTGGAVFYYKYHSLEQRAQLITQNTALMAFSTGDYTTSIDNLRSLIPNAPTKTEQGRLQVLLASSLLARLQSGDLAESVSLFKKVVNDYSIAPWVRALALNNIAAMVFTRDTSFYSQNFNDEQFGSYLPVTGSDIERVNEAYYQILKLSDETYPNSFAEYAIAGNYFAPKIVNNSIPAADREKTARLMQQYIKEADGRNDSTLYAASASTYLTELLYRATGLSTSGKVLDNVSMGNREEAYAHVLNTADQISKAGRPMNSPLTMSVLLRTRFFYASFLLVNHGEKRVTDIQKLLAPFSQGAETNPYLGSLRNLQNMPDTTFIKSQALSLAKISPDFKQFLEKTGVTIK